jgi:putative peptidoglycan lipid II flippase
VVVGIVSIAINIFFSIILVKYMAQNGLALAYSLAGVVNIVILLGLLKWRLDTIDGYKILKTFAIATGASAVMYAAARFTVLQLDAALHLLPKINELIMVVAGMGVGVIVYGVIILLFKLEESQLILNILKKRIPGLNFLG